MASEKVVRVIPPVKLPLTTGGNETLCGGRCMGVSACVKTVKSIVFVWSCHHNKGEH